MKIGILGGGQLARMLALAGHPIGIDCLFLDPAEEACSAPLGEQLCAPFTDPAALDRLATEAERITFEFENVAPEAIAYLADRRPVAPGVSALATARDRLLEKQLFSQLQIPVAPFVAVGSLEELQRAVATVGLPAILKSRTLGYDGKGQAVIRHLDDLPAAWAALAGAPAIVEAFVPFERELSVIAVRDWEGQVAFYPLSENHHREGILRLSLSRPDHPLTAQAQGYIDRLLSHFNYVGVLALELFQVGEQLLANEMAPRVHNSGHWTIEGAEISQFENHLRAVAGLPLGSTAPVGATAMINFIGSLPESAPLLAIPGAHLHRYGKAERPGRKVGHVTLRADSAEELELRLAAVTQLLGREVVPLPE